MFWHSSDVTQVVVDVVELVVVGIAVGVVVLVNVVGSNKVLVSEVPRIIKVKLFSVRM